VARRKRLLPPPLLRLTLLLRLPLRLLRLTLLLRLPLRLLRLPSNLGRQQKTGLRAGFFRP
jgi:hypothetical protein